VREPQPDYLPKVPEKSVKVEVKLADGKVRQIQSMTATTFWSADGRPMSAAQFLESLYGVLPAFFKDEDQLRALWSLPDTRRKLLDGLAEKGFSREPLAEMQKVIEAQSSDLFDVLAYVAFALAPHTRVERAAMAKTEVHQQFTDKQQAFVDFVLAQYVKEGVEELDAEKLAPLLRLRYHNAIADAVADLGSTEQIRKLFVGFQRHLYEARR
jgi:type I restriction enzyme R subunit